MRLRHWLPWALLAGAAAAWEIAGLMDARGETAWTLSRVVWWVDEHKVRLGVPVALVMVATWLHWFAGPRGGGGDEA